MDYREDIEMRLSELLADRSDSICDLAIEIRRVVAKRSKSASELIYSGYAVSNVFSYSHRLREAYIHIATYAKHVNLGFNQGTQLPDPKSVLSGNGKLIRHVRINAISDLERPEISDLIDSAIKLGRKMAEESGGILTQTFIDKSG